MTGEDCSQPPEGVAGDHVAVPVDDVEMHRVAAALAHAADRRLADAGLAHRLALAENRAGVDDLAVALDRARAAAPWRPCR